MMTARIQQEVMGKLAGLCDLSPGVRVGQRLAHLGFLADDMFGLSLWDIDDEQLLQVIERHQAGLASRQSNVA